VYAGGLDFQGKDITLESSNGPDVTIIHGGSGTAVRIGPNGTIRGFTITGTNFVAPSGTGIDVTGQSSLISGNIFDSVGTAISGADFSPTIERNIFRNNVCQGWTEAVVTSSALIVNNVFENNPCQAIYLRRQSADTSQVINNTFVKNYTAVVVDRVGPQTPQIYRNNVIVQNGYGLDLESTGSDNPTAWENNLVFGNYTNYSLIADQTGIAGNLSVDPLFVDTAAGNYRLQTGSPAIDTGNANGAPAIDFDGVARPQDGDGDGTAIFDIGAFEVTAP
jgi:hypothetical protein